MTPATTDFFQQVKRAFRAEFFRHWRSAPISLVMATVVFPFITIASLYYFPTIQMIGKIYLQSAAYSMPTRELPLPVQRSLQTFIEGLREQPYYQLQESANARAAYERGDVPFAIEFQSVDGANEAPRLEIVIHRKNDFISGLFVDFINNHMEKHRLQGLEQTPDPITPADAPATTETKRARTGVSQVAPFILLGFAWFFLTVGLVESFVTERERRTLESILVGPNERMAVASGKLLFVWFQASGPQLTSALALIWLGFSLWVLSLTFLILLLLIPASIFGFRIFRDTDDSLAAGWRTGLVFMLGFPVVIMSHDVSGTLSPLYHLHRVFEQTPSLSFLSISLLFSVGAAVVSLLCLPRFAQRWYP